MHILHAHYQPENSGSILFWAETSDVLAPRQPRAAKKTKSRPHPFCADTTSLKNIFNLDGVSKTVTLRLPAVRGIPLPSPQLIHNWDLDTQSPALDLFLINGIWMKPADAISVLLDRVSMTDYPPAPDLRYWSMVAALALETLAAHKLIPALVAVERKYEARWLPVLDAAKDAARLVQLESAMPAVCRAALDSDISQKIINQFHQHLLRFAGAHLGKEVLAAFLCWRRYTRRALD